MDTLQGVKQMIPDADHSCNACPPGVEDSGPPPDVITGPPPVDAAHLRARGFALCKPDPGSKSPTAPRWSARSLEPQDFGPGDLYGIMGGPLSDANQEGMALVILDLDHQAAVGKADDFLPPTGMEEGRPGKPRDHRYYLVPLDTIPERAWSQAAQASAAAKAARGHPGPWKKGFNHAQTKERLIDFIGTGGQVVCPSPGNQRQWVGGVPGEPAVVPFPALWDATCRLAEACGARAERPPEPARPRQPQAGGANTDRILRTVAYLATIDPAVSGQDGHAGTYWPARVACYGFDHGEELGFQLLREHFNPRCNPPWTEKELRHKCHDADTLPFDKPRGWLRDAPLPERNGSSEPAEKLDGADVTKQLTNFEQVERENAGGKVEVVRIGLPVQKIARQLYDLSGGWPKRTGRSLFVRGKDRAPLWLESTDDIFGWAASLLPGDRANALLWAKGVDKATQAQFAAYLRQSSEDFDAVEAFAHWPQRPRTYYLDPDPKPSTSGKALGGLLEWFSWATPADRDLFLAVLLTQVWGGEPGQRPAILVTTSDEGDPHKGRGAGKTTVVRKVGQLFGGLVLVDAREEMTKVKTRLLSAEGRGRRVVLIDNIKSLKFSWAELEAMITSDVISGHQMYVGEGRRPNTFTWFLTVNGASMSRDMAQRVVTLQVNRAHYAGDWEAETTAYIEQRRSEIIGDLIAILRAPGNKLARFTRWAAWEAAVLSRVGDPGEAQKVIVERQAEIDEDENESATVREAFVAELLHRGHNYEMEAVRIPAMAAAAIINGALGERFPAPKASAFLRTLSIPEIRKMPGRRRGRAWEWRGAKAAPGQEPVELRGPPPSQEFWDR